MDHGSVFNRLHSSCDDLQVIYHAGIFSRGDINKVPRYSRETGNCQSFFKITTDERGDKYKFGIFS